MGFFNISSADNSTVLKHIFKVNKVAVMHMLSEIVSIVEMDNTLLVSLNNIGFQQNTLSNILTNLTCHIVTLNAVNGGVFIGVFLFYFLIVALNKA